MSLPSPGLDMDDLSTADWLRELADHYGSVDRLSIRRTARRLEARHGEALDQKAREHHALIVAARAELEDVESELENLPRDAIRLRARIAELEVQP